MKKLFGSRSRCGGFNSLPPAAPSGKSPKFYSTISWSSHPHADRSIFYSAAVCKCCVFSLPARVSVCVQRDVIYIRELRPSNQEKASTKALTSLYGERNRKVWAGVQDFCDFLSRWKVFKRTHAASWLRRSLSNDANKPLKKRLLLCT